MSEAVRITISRCGEFFAVVDAEAEALVRRYRWTRHFNGSGQVYARAERCPDTGRKIRLYMHRLIAAHFLPPPPTPEHKVVDHGRGGTLDNRALNLKWQTDYVNRWVTARWNSPVIEEQLDLAPF